MAKRRSTLVMVMLVGSLGWATPAFASLAEPLPGATSTADAPWAEAVPEESSAPTAPDLPGADAPPESPELEVLPAESEASVSTAPGVEDAEELDAKAEAPEPNPAWQALLDRDVAVTRHAKEPFYGKLVSLSATHAGVLAPNGIATMIPCEEIISIDPHIGDTTAPTKDASQKDKPAYDGPKLGWWTAHGLGFASWRLPDYRSGGAAYALDVGVGYNFNEKWAIDGVAGGLVGARILDKTTRGNYGRIGAQFRYRSRYFAAMFGIGMGMGRLREPHRTIRSYGLAIPLKAYGLIPLPKRMKLGIGVGWEPSLAPGTVFNGLALQVMAARW